VFAIKKPNSLCKNIYCRKPFYACAFCTRTNAWRAVACSFECYTAYGDQVLEARAAKRNVNLLPERTDMTDTEMKEFMEKPLDEVIALTNEELKDYSGSVADIVTKINEEIDAGGNGIHSDVEEGFKDEMGSSEPELLAPTPMPRKGRKKKTEANEGAI
jgi:hypothetical protein